MDQDGGNFHFSHFIKVVLKKRQYGELREKLNIVCVCVCVCVFGNGNNWQKHPGFLPTYKELI